MQLKEVEVADSVKVIKFMYVNVLLFIFQNYVEHFANLLFRW